MTAPVGRQIVESEETMTSGTSNADCLVSCFSKVYTKYAQTRRFTVIFNKSSYTFPGPVYPGEQRALELCGYVDHS